ncbi:hypothetical protein ACOMHN_002606 [Nucella lapillus]
MASLCPRIASHARGLWLSKLYNTPVASPNCTTHPWLPQTVQHTRGFPKLYNTPVASPNCTTHPWLPQTVQHTRGFPKLYNTPVASQNTYRPFPLTPPPPPPSLRSTSHRLAASLTPFCDPKLPQSWTAAVPSSSASFMFWGVTYNNNSGKGGAGSRVVVAERKCMLCPLLAFG